MALSTKQQLKELYPMFLTNNQVIKEEFLFCTACDDQTQTIDNKLIQCNVCFTTVHELCHQEKFEQKLNHLNWMCLRCEEAIRIFPKQDQFNCYICPQTNLIMKFYEISENKKFKSIWAHIGCIKYVLLMQFDFSEKGQQGWMCQNCKKSEGFLIPCAHKACTKGFHVGCAKYERLIVNKEGMNFIREHYLNNSKQQIPPEARLYCEKHLDLMMKCLKQRVYREVAKGIKLDQMMVSQQALIRFQSTVTDVRVLRKQWTLCNNFQSKSIFALKNELKMEKMEQVQKVENNLQQIIKSENQNIKSNKEVVSTQQQMKIVDNETEVVTTSKKRRASPKKKQLNFSEQQNKTQKLEGSSPTQKMESKQKKPTQREIRQLTNTYEQEIMKSYNEELERIYSESLAEFIENNKLEIMNQNNQAIELDYKLSQVIFSKHIEIYNLEAFCVFFTVYLYVNQLVENGRVVFRKSQTSEVVKFWKNVAEKAEILENIKLEQFILQIRDQYMKVIDKDKLHDEQFQIYQQIIDESESMPIL